MAHQICVLTAFSEDRLRQSSNVVASVNCLELPADGHFAWDMRWQGLKSLRENSTYKLSPEGTAESSPGR